MPRLAPILLLLALPSPALLGQDSPDSPLRIDVSMRVAAGPEDWRIRVAGVDLTPVREGSSRCVEGSDLEGRLLSAADLGDKDFSALRVRIFCERECPYTPLSILFEILTDRRARVFQIELTITPFPGPRDAVVLEVSSEPATGAPRYRFGPTSTGDLAAVATLLNAVLARDPATPIELVPSGPVSYEAMAGAVSTCAFSGVRQMRFSGKLRTLPFDLPEGWTYIGRSDLRFHEVRRGLDDGVMIWIPAGEFTMGTAPCGRTDSGSHRDHNDDEHPERTIHLDAFFIDREEVTWRQFTRFCTETRRRLVPVRPDWGGDRHPVINVTWEDAREFAEWVGCTLPTESQWERAARGPDRRKFPWGNDEPYSRRRFLANYDPGNRSDDHYAMTAPARSFPAGRSPYGCLNMAGNVWEWCLDRYGPYDPEADRNPSGPPRGEFRVLRGGSWNVSPPSLRVANRYHLLPSDSSESIGFRCAVRSETR